MPGKRNLLPGIIIGAVAVIAALIALGFVLYQRRGETVFEETRELRNDKSRFTFTLDGSDKEHRLFFITKKHYSSRYSFKIVTRLRFPSGKVMEEEFQDFEHQSNMSSSTTTTNDRLLFKFFPEDGEHSLFVELKDKSGSVSILSVKTKIKKLESE